MSQNAGMTSHTSRPIRTVGDPNTITISGAVGKTFTVGRRPGPIATLLGDAHPEGDHATVHSGDGLFQASIPMELLKHAHISEEGRLNLPNPPTQCWLVKDVRQIEVTDGRQADSLPDEERAKT
ncbi:MAG: hypothetical protein ACI9C1_003949 [Candidatus Aldehydirespiratoraceae bacterium]|jgi:hypothetical protein